MEEYCCLKNYLTQVSFDIIAEASHINATKMKLEMLTEEEWKRVDFRYMDFSRDRKKWSHMIYEWKREK